MANRIAVDVDAHLKGVTKARKVLDAAREEYLAAVLGAESAGISPTKIGQAAGVTEAAIRQTVKRNKR
ncbi:MAG: hypothetical protein HOV97_06015 [Nonomuraea sp.]|nr:hypothetical protein [Sinomonas sp.]NUS02104.1 hypothetical protein [Nonomuraea sp.]